MADKNISGKLIQAFYTTEELSQEPLCNIIIDKGLVVYEKCDNEQVKMKIGDGVNTWSHLKYIGKNSEINDESSSTETTYSSNKIEDLVKTEIGFELMTTLLTGETTIIFTSDEITVDSKLSAVYTSIFGVRLKSATFEDGSLTLTFPAQEEDMVVMALINANASGDNDVEIENVKSSSVIYDDSISGLGVDNVQDAINKLNDEIKSSNDDTEHSIKTVSSEEGLHGIRYYNKKLEVYNKEKQEWETTVAGLPPYPVTDVKTEPLVFIEGIENATLKVSWTKPIIYDIYVDHYNIYGYVGETPPTSISDFTLLTTLPYEVSTFETVITEPYNYVLVTSVSVDDIEQENLSQMATVTIFNVPVKGITLADATWEQINAISEAGLASEYFSIGDTKSISINGTSYDVKIYGFDHDDKTDNSGKAGITFGLSKLLSPAHKMNVNRTNNGGWNNCVLRTTTLRNTIYNQLDNSVRKVIKTVTKKASGGVSNNNALYSSPDTLFLFSEIEVTGSSENSIEGEGTKYPIFTDNTSRVKADTTSTARTWWLRSSHTTDSTKFLHLNTSGTTYHSYADSSNYVCFGFCV